MAVTSRKIISYISSRPGNFTRDELIGALLHPEAEKRGKKRKSNKKHSGSGRELSLIDDILKGFISAGLITKKRNRYMKIHPFILEGAIRINTSGNGVCQTTFEQEIIIKKDDTGGAHNNDLVSVRIVDYRHGAVIGSVEKIVRRGKQTFFARVVHKTRDAVIYNLLDVPSSPEVCAAMPPEEPEPGDMALVRLEEGFLQKRQRCAVITSFSPDDDHHDLSRIIVKHSLPPPYRDYPELSESRDRDGGSGRRNNYTGIYTVTIDGESAKDFDDAVSIQRKGDAYTLYVHIADVSAHVSARSDLDREALSRGTSYYLGNSVIPMLPEILSNDLCSLREGVDRLTMTVEADINRFGAVLDQRISRGVIRVNRRLTYERADRILAGEENGNAREVLATMFELAEKLHARRIEQGSLELALTDDSLIYDNNVVVDIQYSTRLKSHQIIEEFMLCANVVVSRALRENEVPSLYRNHETISPDSLATLKSFLKQINIPFKITGDATKNIQQALRQVAGTEIEHVVNLVILKSLMQASYAAFPGGHFGLGFRDYTHFTSPIRRYPDLVVHRCVKSLIDRTDPPYPTEELIAIGDKSSEMERVAQAAERDFKKLKTCRLMKNRVGEAFMAIVSGVSRYGFYLTLADIPVEGMVPLRALTDDYYLVKEDDFTVIGKRYGRRFRMGDRIRVRLSAVEIERMIIDFEIA